MPAAESSPRRPLAEKTRNLSSPMAAPDASLRLRRSAATNNNKDSLNALPSVGIASATAALFSNKRTAPSPGPETRRKARAAAASQLPEGCWMLDADEETLPDLRALNAIIFPVNYNDRFYKELLHCHPPELNRVVYSGSRAVAAICARLEWDESAPGAVSSSPTSASSESPTSSGTRPTFPPHPTVLATDPNAEPIRVYLMTIGTDPSFRRSGLASVLLNHVVTQTREWNRTLFEPEKGISRIVLHVHSINEEAVSWYLRRGFKKASFERGYYARNRGVEPPDAWRLELDLGEPEPHLD